MLQLRATLRQKFLKSPSDGVMIAFRLPDGTKISYPFHSTDVTKVYLLLKNRLNLCFYFPVFIRIRFLHGRN